MTHIAPYGFYGRILCINLTDHSAVAEPVSAETLQSRLGGKGLATQLLLDHCPAGADPLGPENPLIVTTGPLCNSRVWGGARVGLYAKSPLTGVYAESYSGGKAPEAVDEAGWDAVLVVGQADRPTVLSIHPDGCDFHDAGDLWGMQAYEAEDGARERFAPQAPDYGRPGALVIGPAGENLVPFATVNNDYWRCAGRAGLGAVMGSKRIKAMVFAGNRQRRQYDPHGVEKFTKEFLAKGKDLPGTKAYKGFGTTMMVAMLNNAGAFPAKYWTQGTCGHWEQLSGETYHKEHTVKPHACAKCFMACGRMAEIERGRHKGLKIEGPEYETIYAFGGLCMIEDIAEVAWLNDVCDRLGMDTITAGNLAAMAMEASERGKPALQGREVPYGDPDATASLLEDMAAGRGLGAVLAKGSRQAAKELEMEDAVVHVKGMEPAGYDPRVLKGMGLAYAVSDRGACHLRATFYKPELAGMIPREQIEGKAELFIDFEDRLTLFDTLILCRFYRDLYDWETLGEIIHLVTGLPGDKESLRRIAAQVTDATREFNLREGMRPDDDKLPKALFTPLPTGERITEEEMDQLVGDYYRLRGWT